MTNLIFPHYQSSLASPNRTKKPPESFYPTKPASFHGWFRKKDEPIDAEDER